MNYDLVTHLALAMNTKVVHNDTLNMFKLIARSPNHFMYNKQCCICFNQMFQV